MGTGVEKSAQARGGFRDGIRTRDADGIEAEFPRGRRKLGLQRCGRQKSRSA
jgi:hypothetical protein